MRTTLLIALAITLASTSAFAKDSEDSAKDNAKKQEMMKVWQEYSTPGAPHKIFEKMAGKWKYTSKWWETSDAKPQESTGTSTTKLIFGGRFLEQNVKGKAMGMPFEGMGISGYDNTKKKYESFWLDNMGTGVMHSEGTFDPETQTLKDTSKGFCPTNDDKICDFRSEWKIVDKDHMIYTMWGPDLDGKEFKQMELAYKRTK